MNWRRSWAVARKDLAEIRTNRWVLLSVLVVPLVIAVVIPVATVAPLTLSHISFGEEPLPLSLHLNTSLEGGSRTNATVAGTNVNGTLLVNSTVVGSFVGNTTLVRVYVIGSVLWHVRLVDSVVRDSNLYNSSYDGATLLSGSVLVGQENPNRAIVDQLLTYFLLFFVLIPVMVPTTMASYTVVGEKVNRSLEPLLASPLSETELLVGKSIAILLPSIAATWASFGIFTALISEQLTSLLGSSPVPNLTWILTIFLVAPVVCVLSIATNVLISSRVSDVRLSQQLGSLVILPLLALFLGGAIGLFAVGPLTILLFAGVLVVATAGVLYLAVRVFDREEILVRWK